MWSLRIRPLGASSSHGIEYAHNSLPVSGTGLSPFEGSLGYQPPIFSSLESEVAVPSAHAFVQRCRRTLEQGQTDPPPGGGHAPRPRLIATGQGLPSMSSVKKCGFHLRTFLSVPFVTSLPLNSLARLLSPRSLVWWRSASNFLQRTGRINSSLSCFQIKTCCSCFH